MRAIAIVATSILALVAVTACRSDLQPAPQAASVAGADDAATDRIGDVEVVAQAAAWPGPVAIGAAVTPMRVVIDNAGPVPLRLRYRDFALIAPGGRRLAALPPLSIDAAVATRVRPAFGARGFAVAPHYGPFYDRLPVYPGPFPREPGYYGTYYPYWRRIELPTAEMLERALPEGVLAPGGRIDGYVYFEPLPEDVRRVTFRADLVDADDGTLFGEARIPFVIE